MRHYVTGTHTHTNTHMVVSVAQINGCLLCRIACRLAGMNW